MAERRYLYLIWKDPETRTNYTIGKLSRAEKYTFEYFDEYKKAQAMGWNLLESFPEEILYESDIMFPAFSSRLPDRKRRDINTILKKYGLNDYDEYELLRKSGARLPIDTYEFIDPIFPEDETIERDFYIMGIRYNTPCKGKDCSALTKLEIGDYLSFIPEPQNPHDENAIRIETQNGERLGYVPRYYNREILARLRKQMSYSCRVLEINMSENCSECIKVKLNIPSAQ